MLLKFHNNQYPSPCISIASTSLELLEWIKSITGIGSIKSKKNYKPDKHVDSYTYLAKYNNAITLIDMVEPYLVIHQKKLRARLILDSYKSLTPRNGRYNAAQRKAKENFYEQFMAL